MSTLQWHKYNYYYLFNRLDTFSHRVKPPSIPPRTQDKIAGATSNAKGVLANFPTPILPKIGKEPTRESLINLHGFISGSVVCVESNLGGIRYGRLALTMASKVYMEQTG